METNEDHSAGGLPDHRHGYVRAKKIPYRGHWLVEQAVLRHTSAGDRIFDGGCSSGYLAERFVGAGRKVDGAEMDPDAAREAARICDQVWVGDLQLLQPSDLIHDYQVLLFADLLEHLPDPLILLRRLREKLKPEGVVIVSLPNVANWTVRLRLLAGRFDYRDRGLLDRTHLRFFTPRTAAELLEQAGFEVIDRQVSVPVPGVATVAICRFAHAVGNLAPGFFGYNIVLTGRLRVS